jgi:hypothetical protein
VIFLQKKSTGDLGVTGRVEVSEQWRDGGLLFEGFSTTTPLTPESRRRHPTGGALKPYWSRPVWLVS